MENWNQDQDERYSKSYGLYIKFQGCRKWPWTWSSQRKSQGHRPNCPGHGNWQKACINICKHILKFSNCVFVRVLINNINCQQVKTESTFCYYCSKKHLHELPWCDLMLASTRPTNMTRINKRLCQHTDKSTIKSTRAGLGRSICSCRLCIKPEVYWSTMVGPGEATYFICIY